MLGCNSLIFIKKKIGDTAAGAHRTFCDAGVIRQKKQENGWEVEGQSTFLPSDITQFMIAIAICSRSRWLCRSCLEGELGTFTFAVFQYTLWTFSLLFHSCMPLCLAGFPANEFVLVEGLKFYPPEIERYSLTQKYWTFAIIVEISPVSSEVIVGISLA